MRQVPNFSSYLLIGSGKLSKHLEAYLKHLGLPFITWSRRSGQPLDPQLVENCSHVLLAIKDDALGAFVQEYSFLKEKNLVHFSGAISVENMASAHPLMTFSDELYEANFYPTIPFLLDEKHANLGSLLPGFQNPCYYIAPDKKAFYHALCVMAGNFPYILWLKAQKEFQGNLGVPPAIMMSYLQQVMSNCFKLGSKGLTGPLVRGDTQTMSKHLETLKHDPFCEVYQAFVNAYQLEQR